MGSGPRASRTWSISPFLKQMHVLKTCKSFLYGLSFLVISTVRHLSRYHTLRRRLFQCFLLTLFLWSTVDVILVRRHFGAEQTHLDYKPPERQRIFISSLFQNYNRSLPNHWIETVVELASVFGTDNIYVSASESGSTDETKNSLRELDKALDGAGVGRSIAFSDTSAQDEKSMTAASAASRNPPYIPQLRNRALQPLYDLRDAGILFDRILFLGDVVFTVDDVLSLLNTNYGTYTAACSFDILNRPSYPDTLALRDADGYEHVMQKWPFFRSSRSKDAIKSMLPIPVRSCWSGMVFMSTEAFYSTRPIRFRGVPEGLAALHIEASECCLIHADNLLSTRRGVYLNPFVRVGHDAPSAARPTDDWLSTWRIFESLWENRLRRWFTFPSLEGWSLRRRVSSWEAQDDKNHESGDFCLIDQLQPMAT
ncbi:glycosyltransferase family 69 protein [Aspergillus lucknowensis]|uniref:Cryptococcal mannosyltransferase 1-domain-containing protein n=1 Tax=Aspergillus lucknowensis TaxID=176173 RepID=A0ABR4LNN3_9EURO